MKRGLVIAAFCGPVLLGAALSVRIVWPGSVSIGSAIVYAAAGLVCHQRPDRSFATYGVQWPVCARCAGLYLAAPMGALAGLIGLRRVRHDRLMLGLILASLPTAASWAAEHLAGVPQTNLVRAVLALPLGAAVACLVVRAAPQSPRLA